MIVWKIIYYKDIYLENLGENHRVGGKKKKKLVILQLNWMKKKVRKERKTKMKKVRLTKREQSQLSWALFLA